MRPWEIPPRPMSITAWPRPIPKLSMASSPSPGRKVAPVLHLNDTMVEAVAKSEIENDPLMPQMRVLADLGQMT